MASDAAMDHPERERINPAQWRVIIRASLGGALEFYDFVIYSMFAQYIGQAFFPAHDPLISLTLSFAVFGVGYLARPVGGVILGHFGDRYGRRRVFIATILVMSCSTVTMGLLPTYATMGYAATGAMILLRLMQGFCLGGELPGAITYVVETLPRRAGFGGGIIFFCVNSGVGLASLLSLVVHTTLTADQVSAWGWRIGFLCGGLCGLISFWLRLSLEETQEFKRMAGTGSRRPFAELIASHPGQILTGIGAIAATAGFNGLLFASPAFFATVMHYAPVTTIEAQNLCLLVLSVGLLTVAWIGDMIPRRWLLGIGSILIITLSYPFYHAAANGSVNLLVLFAAAGVVASFVNGTFMGIAADLFPTRIRFSGVAVVLNISFCVFGGVGPLLSTVLVSATGSPTGPAWFMILCGVLCLAASLVLKRYDGRILGELAARESAAAQSLVVGNAS
jgi:MFS transporter, MHS family, proline/betaine transporter